MTDIKYDERHYKDRDARLRDCIICDLDGTLSLMNGRNPYDYTACYNDKVNTPVWELLKHLFGTYVIIILSGRGSEARHETERWLEKYNIKYYALYMRKAGDMRRDTIVKQEMYDAHIKDKFNVVFALDDRNMMVDHWREMGIPCFQVWYGDF